MTTRKKKPVSAAIATLDSRLSRKCKALMDAADKMAELQREIDRLRAEIETLKAALKMDTP